MLCLVTVRVVSVLGPCHWDVLDRKDMHLLNDRNTDFKQFSKSRKVCRIDNFSWKTSLIMYLFQSQKSAVVCFYGSLLNKCSNQMQNN